LTLSCRLDAAVFAGLKAEVWLRPGAEPTQGKLYRDKAAGMATPPEGISAVLAAGNQVIVTVADLLHQLVVHDGVVAVKLNPANDFTGSQLERMLAPLHSRGFFRCLKGGADVSQVIIGEGRVSSRLSWVRKNLVSTQAVSTACRR